MDIGALYQIAQSERIPVIPACIPENGSLCIQTGDLRCYIGLDLDVMDDVPTLAVHLAHELGHCVTGSFYNRWASCDLRQKHENRADRWAIERLVPREQYDAALRNGCTEIWNLAEYFDVTEDFMRKVVCLYTYGNLAADLYL